MPVFRYKARDRAGGLLTGTLETSGPDAVAEHLSAMGYVPVRIEEERPGLFSPEMWDRFRRVRSEDLILFNRQLATLVHAGIPFLTCLDTLANQVENRKLRQVILEVRRDVEGGASFSDALAKHPRVFSELYVNMIRAGEEGGVLDEILDRLAALAEHEAETRARIKAALRYPVIVVVAIMVAFGILVTFVIPRFAALYSRFHVELPLPTRILIGINDVVQNYGILILAGLAAAALGLWLYIKTPKGREQWDRLKIRVPIIGILILKTILSRFSRVFAALSRSGLPILRILDILMGTLGNVVIQRAVETIRESVREGRSIAEPMRASGVFPPIVQQMVAVGEETGNLDEMLNKVSDYYDMEVEYAIRNLSTTLEPVLLLFIGGMVLFLALAIFLPWWDLVKIARPGG